MQPDNQAISEGTSYLKLWMQNGAINSYNPWIDFTHQCTTQNLHHTGIQGDCLCLLYYYYYYWKKKKCIIIIIVMDIWKLACKYALKGLLGLFSKCTFKKKLFHPIICNLKINLIRIQWVPNEKRGKNNSSKSKPHT